MHGRIGILLWLTFLAGCTEPTATTVPTEPETPLADAFNPATCGTIRGQVVWDGDVPASEEHLIRAIAYNPNLHKNPARYVTPHIPKVHSTSRGIENAVVYLRAVEPRRSKAWDQPKVRVEFHERQLLVRQDTHLSQVGFVRRGSAIDIVNRDAEYHNLHARGAAFFAMPLITPNQLHERKLTQAGVVDLRCGAGYYWLHAHLFVAEHPYYVRTDAEGRFTLDQVPAGSYELVCWLPSWRVARKEVDPETGIIARLAWEAPKEQTATVRVAAGKAVEADYQWTRIMFE